MNNTIIAIVVSLSAAIGIIVTTALYFYPAISNGSILGTLQDKEEEDNNNHREPVMAEDGSTSNKYRTVIVSVNGIDLVADVAATNEQRAKGLSVKDSLPEYEAMLFVFETAQEHSFWMKNMKFPIDIIWLDSDKAVVHIEHYLQPCSLDVFCPSYKPNNNALYVLETVAGFAQKHDIVEGTRIEFQLSA
jgi:uncharacterized membrane protein (UPF0127 family)